MATSRKYKIGSDFNLAKVQAKAKTLAARAVKKGLSGGYELSFEYEEIKSAEGAELVTWLVISGEPVKYSGWSFVAVAEYENGQAVVSGSPWYEGEQVDRSALKDGYCDACQVSRSRGKTIIVESESGERKQVGSSCVKDFLGAEVGGAWYSEKDPFAELDKFGGSGKSLYTIKSILTAAAQVVRVNGAYVGKYSDSASTKSEVIDLIGLGSMKPVAAAKAKYGSATEEDAEQAAEVIEFAKALEGESDWAANVKAVFAGEYIEYKRFGLVISVVGAKAKAEGKAAEQAAVEKIEITEALYAEAGAKVEIPEAVVTFITGFETQWGFTQVIYLVGEGYRFKWMTSSYSDLKEGDKVAFKATVKGLDEYNGKISTQVLRVKAVAA
jgi:hypothetical protein